LGRLAALRRLPCLLARTLLGCALFRRRPRRGRAQVLQQLLQRLGILAQGFLARLAVLVAAVQLGQQRSALAAVAAQRGQGFLLAGAQRLQLGTALGDAFLHRGQFRQRGRQRLHLARVLALGIAVVG